MESCLPRDNPSVVLDQSYHHYSYCKENVFNSVCCFYTKRDQFEPYAWQNWVFILWLFLPVMLDELPVSHLVEWKRKRHSVGTTGFLAAQRTESERHFLSDPFSLDSLPPSPLPPPSLFPPPIPFHPHLCFSLTLPLPLLPLCSWTLTWSWRFFWHFSTLGLTAKFCSFSVQWISICFSFTVRVTLSTWLDLLFFGPVSWAATQHSKHPVSHF